MAGSLHAFRVRPLQTCDPSEVFRKVVGALSVCETLLLRGNSVTAALSDTLWYLSRNVVYTQPPPGYAAHFSTVAGNWDTDALATRLQEAATRYYDATPLNICRDVQCDAGNPLEATYPLFPSLHNSTRVAVVTCRQTRAVCMRSGYAFRAPISNRAAQLLMLWAYIDQVSGAAAAQQTNANACSLYHLPHALPTCLVLGLLLLLRYMWSCRTHHNQRFQLHAQAPPVLPSPGPLYHEQQKLAIPPSVPAVCKGHVFVGRCAVLSFDLLERPQLWWCKTLIPTLLVRLHCTLRVISIECYGSTVIAVATGRLRGGVAQVFLEHQVLVPCCSPLCPQRRAMLLDFCSSTSAEISRFFTMSISNTQGKSDVLVQHLSGSVFIQIHFDNPPTVHCVLCNIYLLTNTSFASIFIGSLSLPLDHVCDYLSSYVIKETDIRWACHWCKSWLTRDRVRLRFEHTHTPQLDPIVTFRSLGTDAHLLCLVCSSPCHAIEELCWCTFRTPTYYCLPCLQQ